MERGLSTQVRGAPRLTAADWVAAALDAIVREGVGAVAVEPLAVRLGATKGSFYHHFENREALVKAALDNWERTQGADVIARLRLIADPRERLRAVMVAALTDRFGGLRDAALLSSSTDQLVKSAVARETERRLRYLTETYAEMGLSKPRARRRALLYYAAYLGLFEILRVQVEELDGPELRAYAHELVSTLVPPGPQAQPAGAPTAAGRRRRLRQTAK
jgi:AcrR family transcriptional regulator